MIEIEVFNRDYRCSCVLERSLTILTGLSGVGKTILAESLFEYNTNKKASSGDTFVGVSISNSKLEIQRVTDEFLTAVYSQFKSISTKDYVCTFSNTLFIVDDDCTKIKEGYFNVFLRGAVRNGCYFLIITHDITPLFNALKCSVHSVLRMVKDDATAVRRIEPYYNFVNVSSDDYFTPDLVITEDSKSGYDWFKALFKEVDCKTTNGNRNFKGVFEQNAHIWRDKKILFIFDTAAYGVGFKSLITTLQLYDYKLVRIIPSYECFEYLLLSSNLLCNFDGNLVKSTKLCDFANKFFTWEQFFEHHLEELTAGTCFQYKHLSPKDLKDLPEDKKKALQYECRFRKCYFMNCSDVSNEDYCRGKLCEQFIETSDKFDHMLRGTEFECLLDYRKDAELK